MNYCKYENAYKQLKELNEIIDWNTDAMKELSESEYSYMIKIIKYCMNIKNNYDYNNIF